ncbi:MAG: OmpA family protein [Desulfovibrio sp.]|jgi:OOP family OmpA-OmpF porin|nr:OmpA family protein [Desulfovibrio sp.]
MTEAEETSCEEMDEELIRLRSLLFQREIDTLNRLNAKLADPEVQTERVASVIAEALAVRAAKDERLRISLEPTIEKVVTSFVRSSPQEFVNVFFPIMGPAIRKSLGESFRGMLQEFSKSLEMSFSWKGLRWRLEAMRSGRPFSEIVLLRTLVYRVEEVYFIHSATGITLMHEANEGVDAQDEGMVAAMLTAIQDFVQDSFTGGGSGQLESLRHGDHLIIVEKRPQAYLACIVRGSPPLNFAEQCRVCLDRLLVSYARELAAFDGDSEPFESGKILLTQLMQSRFVDDDRGIPWWTTALIVGFILLGAAGFGYMRYLDYQEEQIRLAAEEQTRVQSLALESGRWAGIDLLREEPGLVVVSVRPLGAAPWEVTCLKDELAQSAEQTLRAGGHDPGDYILTVVPAVSYEQSIVRRRVEAAIKPPQEVRMRFDDAGTLHLSGTAPTEWTLEARRKAQALPGVKNVEVTELFDPRMTRLARMTKEVASVSVEFPSGKDTPVPEDVPKLNKAVDTLVEIAKMAESMGMSASLTVYGHADATGTDKRNYEISQARARTIAAMLYARGSSMPVALYGMGADYASSGGNREDQSSRRIELHVRLVQASTASLDGIVH